MGLEIARRAYLIGYNGSLALSWLAVLVLAVKEWAARGPAGTFGATADVLKVAQTAAVLEVLHAYLGIVRSPYLVTALQVGSRVGIFWGILWSVPETRVEQIHLFKVPLSSGQALSADLGLSSMLLCWSLSEIIRYTFYFCKECGLMPWLVVWARYSGFLVFYPLGVASELTLIWLAMPYITQRQLYSIKMPNKFNFAFDASTLATGVMASYVYGFPMLYGYMLRQRKKALAPKQD